MRPRAVVVTVTDAIFAPLAVVTDVGLTVQVVAWAGTVQESVTGEENPKKGVMAMSFTYDAVCPAATVCKVNPRSATVKSATKFKATDAEFDVV
jgi:hypothetical protein